MKIQKIYLSRAIFLVCPEPRLSTTSQRSTTLVAVALSSKFTSITCNLTAELELLNNLDIWNFLHFFSGNGFLKVADKGSTQTE